MSLDQFLRQLQQEGVEVKHTSLLRFSNLTPDETNVLKRSWLQIASDRRRSIVGGLVQMAEDDLELDFSAVFKLCLYDSDEEVRRQAISGLWECEERSLIPRLIELLDNDPSTEVRATAASGLGRFAQLAVEGKLLEKDMERVQGALLRIIEDTSHPLEVYRRALEAVAPFNTTEIQECIQRAYDGTPRELQCSALYAMGRSCDSRWLAVLLHELQNDDAAIRYEAAHACGELGDEEAVLHLARLLRDEDYEVQLAAIRALSGIGGRQARLVLQAQLDSSEEGIAEVIQEALQRLDVEGGSLTP